MAANIKKDNLIGLKVKVIDADNKSQISIEGKIIDETRNTIKVQTTTEIKQLMKNNITLMINDQKINGKNLVGRPEERIKKSR